MNFSFRSRCFRFCFFHSFNMCIVVIGNRKMPVFVASHINIVAKPINLQNTGHQTFVSISSKLYESSSEALYILCQTNLEYSMNSSIFSRGIICGGGGGVSSFKYFILHEEFTSFCQSLFPRKLRKFLCFWLALLI